MGTDCDMYDFGVMCCGNDAVSGIVEKCNFFMDAWNVNVNRVLVKKGGGIIIVLMSAGIAHIFVIELQNYDVHMKRNGNIQYRKMWEEEVNLCRD